MKIVDRRGFLRSAARGAAIGGAYFAFGDVAAALARPRILHWSGTRALDEQFTILAIGDSIMWGQGLKEEAKFTTQVANWVKSQLPGRLVTLHQYAHSGAVIKADEEKDAQPATPGEVPNGYPSITFQFWKAAASLPPEAVDLVLLNGGIHDVKINTILTTDPSITDKIGRIREDTRTRCAAPLRVLLSHVLQKFPQAKVVVPSYFPMVSGASPLDLLPELVNRYNPTRPLAGAATEALRTALAEQSRAFHNAYVSTVRPVALGGLKPATTTTPTGPPRRTAFALVPFAPENCYGAPDRWLWRAGEPDQVTHTRRQQCQAAGLTGLTCRDAQLGHPNVEGAAAYARAITAQLEAFLPDWRPTRQPPQTGREAAPPRADLPTRIGPPVRR
jgi:GDSL-like lipase/acylhydrolase family protein